jgi:DNA-directed RNA polymerase specialized sigma24 family protein
MISDDNNPIIEALQNESQLVSLAKTGDADAFVQLYDAYVEGVYRYVYFRVINDKAAEDLTSQVFREAWENLHSCPMDGSTFVKWIYEIGNNLVLGYYKTDLKSHAIDIDFLSVPADYGLNKEVQDLIKLEVMRNHLRFLAAEPKQNLILKFINYWTTNRNIGHILSKLEGDIHTLQVSTLQTVAKFLEYLNLGREIKPSPAFNARTRLWLTQYLQFHSSRPQRISTVRRISVIYVILILAFLVTGTAKAQSALPGDVLYGWKRTSEQALQTISIDPVGTDIFLANRRLNELIAVEKDPARSNTALNDYYDALNHLKSTGDPVTSARILPVLKAHKERLNESGLSTASLDNYLTTAANPTTVTTSVQNSPSENIVVGNNSNIAPPVSNGAQNQVIPVAPGISSDSGLSVIGAPTIVASQPAQIPSPVPTTAVEILTLVPAVTNVPAVVAPITTDVPTVDASLATQAPTDAALAPTNVPSVVAHPPTQAATDAVSAATSIPSAVAAPATQAPIVVVPPPTDVTSGNTNPVAPATPQAPSVVVPPPTDVSSGSTNPNATTNNPGASTAVATP